VLSALRPALPDYSVSPANLSKIALNCPKLTRVIVISLSASKLGSAIELLNDLYLLFELHLSY